MESEVLYDGDSQPFWNRCQAERHKPTYWSHETQYCSLNHHPKKFPHMFIERGVIVAIWTGSDEEEN